MVRGKVEGDQNNDGDSDQISAYKPPPPTRRREFPSAFSL